MKRKSKKNILWAIGREIVIIGICAIIAQGIVIMSYDEMGESVIGDGEIVFLFILGLQYAITW
nr:hypothetical protein [Patescibacteria group bacterium]